MVITPQTALDSFNRWITALAQRIEREKTQPVFQRDPALLRRVQPYFDAIRRYYEGELRGLDRAPRQGPALLVGNHSGGLFMPEAYTFAAEWLRHRLETPLYGLAHDLLFALPFARVLPRLGIVPADMNTAMEALKRKGMVLVYPGGDYEVFRPFRHRNRVDFGVRRGFIRLALRTSAPIVPIVSQGSHESVFVVARGEELAKRMRLERVGVKIFPFVLGPPWGLVPGFVPTIPIPTRVIVEICPPMAWPHLGPEAADDPKRVEACYREVIDTMQATLDRLRAENPRPVFTRLSHLAERLGPVRP